MTHFIDRISNHEYPSKEELEFLHTQKLNRVEICQKLNISISTYKKLRRYYGIQPKPRKVDLSTCKGRAEKAQNTILQRYGEKGSDSYNNFYRDRRERTKQTNLEKYGVEDPTILPEFMEKRKQTYIQKYGVDNPMKSSLVQEKAQQTDLLKYGSRYHINSSVVKSKTINTLMEQYGVSTPSKVPGALEKRDQTNLKKYGHVNPLANPEIRAKAYKTMSDNGTEAVLSSRPQKHINNLFGGKLNYLFTYYHVDSYLVADNIVVEYAGTGHDLSVRTGRETLKHFLGKEKARMAYFRNLKIPVLEFISKTDKLPSDEILLQHLENAKQKFSLGILYYCVNLDTNQIQYN